MSQDASNTKPESRGETWLPEAPGLSHAEILELPISTLAYLGDAVYELYVRRHLLLSGHVNVPSHHLYLASALEALLGELYCAGQTARLDELMKQILGLIESAPKALRSVPGGET